MRLYKRRKSLSSPRASPACFITRFASPEAVNTASAGVGDLSPVAAETTFNLRVGPPIGSADSLNPFKVLPLIPALPNFWNQV